MCHTQVCKWRGVRGLFLRWAAARLRHAELWEAGEEFLQRFHRAVGPRQEDRIWRLR